MATSTCVVFLTAILAVSFCGVQSCVTYNSTSGVHSTDGVPIGVYSSADDCQYVCGWTIANCVGIDVVNLPDNTVECWAHIDHQDLSTLYLNPSIDQYQVYKKCDNPECYDGVWTIHENKNSFFGESQYPANMTVDQCRQTCMDRPDCLAIDYNYYADDGVPRCFLHVKQEYVDTRDTLTGVHQFELQRCS